MVDAPGPSEARGRHTATLLYDGTVLVVGGVYSSGAWTSAPFPAVAHEGDGAIHFEVRLSDVAPAGGVNELRDARRTRAGRLRLHDDARDPDHSVGLRHETVSVVLLDDAVAEHWEMLSIVLGSPANAKLAQAEAFALVLDDDGQTQTATRFRRRRQPPNR